MLLRVTMPLRLDLTMALNNCKLFHTVLRFSQSITRRWCKSTKTAERQNKELIIPPNGFLRTLIRAGDKPRKPW